MGRRGEVGQDVRESDLAALVGLPTRQLQDIVACLVPSKRRGEERWFWWGDIEGFLDTRQLRAARQALRARRMKPHGSKYWIAGYPLLVAQWHPTRNGDLLPDEVRYGSGRMIWWKCPHGPDHEWRAAASARTSRSNPRGCPCCAGMKVSVTNSLATREPAVASQWHPSRNGSLSPADVVSGSTRSVWWQCPVSLEHAWLTQVRSRVDPIRSGCPFCSGRRPSTTNSLATRAPAVATEWHHSRNGDLAPYAVTLGSSKEVWWRCSRDSTHEWSAAVRERGIYGRGCPFCSGRRASAGSCLQATHRQLARQWDTTRNGDLTPRDITAGSGGKVWWRCPKGADHRWQATVKARAKEGTGCPFCTSRRASRTNCLAMRAPTIAAQWHRVRNGPLSPDDVPVGSARSVWWQCSASKDHAWQGQVRSRTGSRQTGCPYCMGRRASVTNSLAKRAPDVAREWHERNGGLTPLDVTVGSHKTAWWRCSRNPAHEWPASIKRRTRARAGCPYCANRRISTTNSLEVTHPELARQWDAGRNEGVTPRDVTAGSGRRVWWRCKRVKGHTWAVRICSRTSFATGCPLCARARRAPPVTRAAAGA